ncbi:hypothetical protein JTB14_007066 [Gonioctena quinquepunctata]|nr:hypothetical protein JTB14_007066 [Gonioctena quinquepunctata]
MRAQGILEVKNLWEAIDPGFDENALKVEENKKKDHSAKSVLYLLVNNDSLDDIMDCKAAKEIWETLKRIHTKFDTWHGLLLLKDYINTTKASDETINQYLNRRNGLYHKVKNAGFEFSEKMQGGFTVLGLPSQYEHLARNLRADENDLNMSNLKSKLLEEERRICNKLKNEKDAEETKAFITQRRQTNSKVVQFKSRRGKPSYNPASSRNTTRENIEYSTKPRFSADNVRCYRCLEMGHIGKNCPLSVSQETKHERLPNETERAENSNSKFAFSAIRSNMIENEHHTSYLVNNKTNSNTWVLDSGSTDHMTSNFEKFSNFTKKDTIVEVAGGKTILSTGFGDVDLKLDEENGGSEITLKSVLYVPELKANLLSTSLAAEKGLKIILKEIIRN